MCVKWAATMPAVVVDGVLLQSGNCGPVEGKECSNLAEAEFDTVPGHGVATGMNSPGKVRDCHVHVG